MDGSWHQQVQEAAVSGHWGQVWELLSSKESPVLDLVEDSWRQMSARRRQSRICWLLGELAMQVKRPEEAYRWYTRCVQHLDERRMNDTGLRVRALCGQGEALLSLGAAHAALDVLCAAYALDMCHGRTLAALSRAHAALGNGERCWFFAQQALIFERDPRASIALYLLLARTSPASAEKHIQVALDVAETLDLHEEAVQCLLVRAQVALRAGDLPFARAALSRAVRLHAHEATPLAQGEFALLRAQIAQAEGRTLEALGYLRLAAQALRDIDVPEACVRFKAACAAQASIYEEEGLYSEALAQWKAALEADFDRE